jgi:hypothetical protein
MAAKGDAPYLPIRRVTLVAMKIPIVVGLLTVAIVLLTGCGSGDSDAIAKALARETRADHPKSTKCYKDGDDYVCVQENGVVDGLSRTVRVSRSGGSVASDVHQAWEH